MPGESNPDMKTPETKTVDIEKFRKKVKFYLDAVSTQARLYI